MTFSLVTGVVPDYSRGHAALPASQAPNPITKLALRVLANLVYSIKRLQERLFVCFGHSQEKGLFPCHNRVTASAAAKWAHTLWFPLPKEEFSEVGQNYGVKVCSSVRMSPFRGRLCVGMSFAFLRDFLKIEEPSFADRIRLTADSFSMGADARATLLQTLYENLLATGCAPSKRALDRARATASACHTHDREVLMTQAEDLDVEGYAALLEVSASSDYSSIRDDAKRAIARALGLSLEQQGPNHEFTEGGYLLSIGRHCVAVVKEGEEFCLFDPDIGASILEKEGLLSRIDFLKSRYSPVDSIRVFSARPQ